MPRRNELGELRRSGVVSTFGPGAVIDFRVGDAPVSVVAAGLEEWDRRAAPAGLANPQTVFEPRLQKQLGVAGFRLPPVYPDADDETRALPGVRFPLWLQCPECHLLKHAGKWSHDPGRAGRKCGSCTQQAPGGRAVFPVPVRFVCACVGGHLDEFPWHHWVGHREGCTRRGDLKLRGEGAGLAGLVVSCLECGASRSMDGAFSSGALRGLSCRGMRPWLASEPEECTAELRVLQRGASNLYFPVVRSAIDIPPFSDSIQRLLGQYWDQLTRIEDVGHRATAMRDLIYPMLGVTGISVEELIRQVEIRLRILAKGDADDLRWDEYLQFTSGEATPAEADSEFEIRPVRVPERLSNHLSHIVRAVRLREVRAISGFTRIHPPEASNEVGGARIAPIQLSRKNWLPAIEVRGEGIFIALDADLLQTWEARPDVAARAAALDARHRESNSERHGEDAPVRSIRARLLLIHTLSHILMRELSLDCGYSSTSLRERLYVGEGPRNMCGLLIYTAAPDADGTLGGLVRQGYRVEEILRHALSSALWCSSDPLCVSGMTSAADAMNNAACHSCVLAAETSCEEYNRFLDRALLIDPEMGFFRDLLTGTGAKDG